MNKETATAQALREARKPKSPPVTLGSLGKETEFFYLDPLAYAAVCAGIPQDEFIRILLAENARLKKDLVEALQRCYSPVVPLPPGTTRR